MKKMIYLLPLISCCIILNPYNNYGSKATVRSAPLSSPDTDPAASPQKQMSSVSLRKQYASLSAGKTISVRQFTRKQIRQLFYKQKIPKKVFSRMKGQSYKKGCPVSRSNLRYLRMLYYGFDKKTHIGEMVVNKKIAGDTLTVFYRLYRAKYPIEKMVLIDNYKANDDASMADNNTSCFNYRPVKGTSRLSNHSYGLAIDINPLYNPYIRTVNGKTVCEPTQAKRYQNRSKKFPHKITKRDLCYRLFHKFGFSWGGDWKTVKDYQHFER